jgi:hypothetical protein
MIMRKNHFGWAGNVSNLSRKITETPLAHVIGDKAEQALSPKRRMRETPEFDGCVVRVL